MLFFFYIFFVDFIDKSTISHESENGKVPATTKRSDEIRVEESKKADVCIDVCVVFVVPQIRLSFVCSSVSGFGRRYLLRPLGLCLMCDCLGIGMGVGLGGMAAINLQQQQRSIFIRIGGQNRVGSRRGPRKILNDALLAAG